MPTKSASLVPSKPYEFVSKTGTFSSLLFIEISPLPDIYFLEKFKLEEKKYIHSLLLSSTRDYFF
jgi:hypothetical protein